MEWKINSLTSSWVKEFVDFRKKSSKETGYVKEIDYQEALKRIKSIEQNNNWEAYIVYKENEEIIGQLFLRYDPLRHSVRIQLISVLDEHSGQGIGKALLDKAVERGCQTNKQEVDLIVHRNNEHAQNFYRSYGFEKDQIYRSGRVRWVYNLQYC